MRAKKFTKIICAAAVAAALTFSGCGDFSGAIDDAKGEDKPVAEKTATVTPTAANVTEAAPNKPESNARISEARNTPALSSA